MNPLKLPISIMKTTARIAALLAFTGTAWSKPLQVYILAGQSNMQGHAQVRTIEHIGMDPATKPMLADMKNAEYHYLGSAKILGGIGKGLAEAMIELRKSRPTR